MTAWEGGHREVGVVSWPGKVRAGAVSHVLASALDYVPTVLALAGVPLPKDRTFDGLDLAPIIFAEDPSAAHADAHHTSLFFSVGGEAYLNSVPNWNKTTPGNNPDPTGLFQAIRLPGLSAMYKVVPLDFSCCMPYGLFHEYPGCLMSTALGLPSGFGG
jgi:hypothetical protein